MEWELKRVDTIARVRRAFHAQGWSMKKITRELHVSRNTVRKILRSGETDFTYEREHQPLPKIGPWVEHIDRFLRANEGKAARERLTLIRIYEVEGYSAIGSRDTPTSRPWICGQLRCCPTPCQDLGEGPRICRGGCLCAALLCAGRGIPVRLEP